ncbi:Protein phosphatase 2C 7 [Cryptotrichosporon argae]
MMRRTSRVLNQHPVSHARARPSLFYSLGVSYAAKTSPPFEHTPSTAGLAGRPSRAGRWVDGMLRLRAGRGDLRSGGEGGWGDEAEMARAVRKWGAGEDFFAVLQAGAYTHLAVSDGVGGWAPQYDPSLYSQSLMYHYHAYVASSPSAAPWAALEAAYAAVERDGDVEAGSATAVGVSLDDTGKGRAVNLGDSGFSILRKDALVYSTSAQTHYFNCPYQLAKIPEAMAKANPNTDRPAHGERLEFDLEPGDIVILYTDGLADNLPQAHLGPLASAVTRLLTSEANAHLAPAERAAERARVLADVLVGYARAGMARTGTEDGGTGWKTPFELEARRHGVGFKGGKIDDITVVTAVVSERM